MDFIAFGHSVGGGMAIVAAGVFSSHCRALITESAQVFVEDRTLDGIREAECAFRQRCQMERSRRYHGDKTEWVFSSWIETWLSGDFSSWKLGEDLRAIHCPVLVLHGDNDEYGSIQHARRGESLTHGPTILKVLSNCGHVPHRETQPIVMDAIREFLRQRTG